MIRPKAATHQSACTCLLASIALLSLIDVAVAAGAEPRIVGGTTSAQGAWPSAAALVRPDDNRNALPERQFCGGTVIAATWVVTAAHCVQQRNGMTLGPEDVRIVVGINDLRAETPIEETVVTNIIVHENYDLPYFDMALLELANVVPVAPAPLFTGDSAALVGSTANVVGWGIVDSLDPGNLVSAPDLREGAVPIVARDICNQPQSYNGSIREGELCAGFDAGLPNHCFGDSGGPLYALIDGVQQLIGVVTRGGRICEAPFIYGVYSDVSFHGNWIRGFVPDEAPPAEDDPAQAGTADTSLLTSGTGSGGGGVGLLVVAVLAGLILLRLVMVRR